MNPLELDDIHTIPSRPRFVPKRKLPPPKTTLAAALMLVGGIVLVTLGLTLGWYKDGERGLALTILGSIILIPGTYASWNLYAAYKGYRGYSYDQIPSYDDY